MTTTKIRVLVVQPGSGPATLRSVPFTLPTFNRLVGGNIEGLSLGEVSAYINEDGKALGLPVNASADLLIRALLSDSGRRLLPGDVIVGPVVFIGSPNEDGEDTDVTDELIGMARVFGLEIEEVPDA